MVKIFEDEYAVAVVKNSSIDLQEPKAYFHVIKNNLFSWAADPFPIEVNGELYIFAELWQYFRFKGCIGYTKLTDTGFTRWKPIISEKYHLSYPNLIKYKNKLYMCPESNEAHQIYLYECVSFPDKWKKSYVLLDNGRFCDTTFFEEDGNIYGFTYQLMSEREQDGKLRIFRLENGKIIFSQQNQDSFDKFCVRPGGKIYYDDRTNQVFRVAQIGTPTYGAGLLFTKFQLDWPYYYEEVKFKLLPNTFSYDKQRKYTGIHTFNISKHYTVIDIKWNRIHPLELIAKTFRKIYKLLKN